ncbi:histone H3/H4 [Methanohalophilus levihalophilus]|uniref:histone family protein n=1 Tax=Methanohalophilus levihalophilus TaxID=1431282 RepID=UPI001AE44DA0|nr:histone family protein [Methanohalophilus levihalophilus]MBP2030890.1 histone H3/H4 [Methanohalophilus levihalophilus]
MQIIPYAPIERVIRKAGADRVSESAGEALAEILEEQGMKISKEAIKLANHAGRKTVKAEDILLAYEMMQSHD